MHEHLATLQNALPPGMRRHGTATAAAAMALHSPAGRGIECMHSGSQA